MTSSVNVTSNPGAPFTWAQSAFAWNVAGYGAQSWANFAPHSYQLAASEGWHTAEAGARQATKALAGGWHTAEAGARQVGKSLAEAWRTTETYADIASFHLRIMEAWATAERLSKVLPALSFAEGWATAEGDARAIGKDVAEAWHTAELPSQVADFVRSFAEGWATAEDYANHFDLNVSEALEVFEFYKRHANGVLSDIILSISDMDLAAFTQAVEYGRPPGFAAFQQFQPGNYSYQSAIFRAVMEAATSDEGVIEALKVQVDVPDTIDGGSASITANPSAGVAVNFNRTFNIVPILTFSVTGGTNLAAVPCVLGAPSKTGFTVALKDPQGNYYTGSVSWAAKGY